MAEPRDDRGFSCRTVAVDLTHNRWDCRSIAIQQLQGGLAGRLHGRHVGAYCVASPFAFGVSRVSGTPPSNTLSTQCQPGMKHFVWIKGETIARFHGMRRGQFNTSIRKTTRAIRSNG